MASGGYGVRYSSSLSFSKVPNIKIVFMGSRGCGKTTLIRRFLGAPPQQETYKPTIGADYIEKNYNLFGTTLKLWLWDISGSEAFSKLAPMFYGGAHVVVLVYDITSFESFERALNLSTEIDKMAQAKGGPRTIFVGTKVDAGNPANVDMVHAYGNMKSISMFQTSSILPDYALSASSSTNEKQTPSSPTSNQSIPQTEESTNDTTNPPQPTFNETMSSSEGFSYLKDSPSATPFSVPSSFLRKSNDVNKNNNTNTNITNTNANGSSNTNNFDPQDAPSNSTSTPDDPNSPPQQPPQNINNTEQIIDHDFNNINTNNTNKNTDSRMNEENNSDKKTDTENTKVQETIVQQSRFSLFGSGDTPLPQVHQQPPQHKFGPPPTTSRIAFSPFLETVDQILASIAETGLECVVNRENDNKRDPRPRWVPDSEVSNCMKCSAPFTISFRRHHCRKKHNKGNNHC